MRGRQGYTFEGWSLSPEGEVLTAHDLVGLAKDTEVYAIWTPKKFTIRFVMKGSVMPPEFGKRFPDAVYTEDGGFWTVKVDFDSTFGMLPPPTKEGAEYRGWPKRKTGTRLTAR